MSTDLSAFFAKKNDKRKKNAVVKMDDVGQILERRAKKQEEHDREADEEEKRGGFEEDHVPGEDSEWIEYDNSNSAGRLDGLNLKDMGAESTENTEEEHTDVAEHKEQHETRTWGQVDKKEDKDIQTAAEMAAYQKAQAKPQVFVPSALREQRNRAEAIDVTNQEMFPSLADASKMEHAKKEDAKTGGGWVKTGQSENRPSIRQGWGTGSPSGPASSGKDRDSALAAIRALNAQTSASAPTPPPPRPVEEPTVKKTPSSGAYVPPHLRNRN